MKNRKGRTVLNVPLDKDLFARFKAARALAGDSQEEAVTEMMERYIARQLEVAGLHPTKMEVDR